MFLVGQRWRLGSKTAQLTVEELRNAFALARVPQVPEIMELFRHAQPKVLQLAISL